ncbi:relaxase [Burkholderia sp. Bp9012]|uniref:MobH family relaxase n=1 Tax=Burkholderia sp. Bp9012 TaxID=2184562 RepID=UPI000F5A7949|nr:MobH family relaxase [Burkholderia sp. Bp9012]RQR79128.1 relaxase [Burkholderia sp. Bp9012]
MFSLFQRKTIVSFPTHSPAPAPDQPSKGLTQPESADSLLAKPRRQKLLEHIWQRTSVSRSQFASLYRAPLERYAELVQQFPASESHHHAYPGGMLDHGLEIVAYALKLRQSHLLPAGAPPEAQAAQAEAWTASVAYAALLHDLGKMAVDFEVEHADGTVWHPWHGPLQKPYRFRYRKEREYRLHNAATGLLYTRILDPAIFDWLSGYPELWAALIYVLAGQYEHAGTLGELVIQADQASVAQELGGDPARAAAAPKQALQRKLLDGLRYLLREEFKLNQPEASDGWLTQDALWLVSKTVSDKLRAHLLSQGMDGIPASNTAVFDVLQDHGIALPAAGGKAIWRATITSATGWSHSFTLLRMSPALIWEAHERPAAFTGEIRVDMDALSSGEVTAPAQPSAPTTAAITTAPASSPPPSVVENDALAGLLDLMASEPTTQAVAAPATVPAPAPSVAPGGSTLSVTTASVPASPSGVPEEPSGDHFISWLRQGVASRKIIINDAKALAHTVADTAYLVSPGVFQRYAQEHPQIARLAKDAQLDSWQWVQKRFEQLRLHRKQASGLNIWTCEITGPRKTRRVHGYLLSAPTSLFGDADVPANNPYLKLIE